MSQLVTLPKPLCGEVLDERGELIRRIEYAATETSMTFSQVSEQARESLRLVTHTFDVFKGHRFKVRDGTCWHCGMSRAKFEFSRRTLECR